jgi:hypothetical protein
MLCFPEKQVEACHSFKASQSCLPSFVKENIPIECPSFQLMEVRKMTTGYFLFTKPYGLARSARYTGKKHL